jgi:FkbH-like protein
MTLSEALGLVQQQKDRNRRRKIFLVCGFQPLHLRTLLQAHLIQRSPNEASDIQTGLYGDLESTVTMAVASQAEAAAVVIEWSDLDPRLGLRSSGGWSLSVQADILHNCQERLARLLGGLEALAAKMPVALVPPTLPITLLGHTAGWQFSLNELELQKQMATFLTEAARINGVSVLNSSSLARVSPEPSRFDPLMELRTGFPYTIAHASAVASRVVKLLFPPNPLKGLITDLDETLWSGIVGEVGVPAVSWSLAEHAQIHGLYQQMLLHLSEMGVLIAVASKNELTVVEAALQREDMLVPGKLLFPVCANWGPKSGSIAEILRIWNIGADSVVFVDDSAMELEEVRTAFPAMTCLQFSKQPARMLEMLQQLRDLFGKPAVNREDALRQASIRANASVWAAGDSNRGEFLRSLQGRLTFDCRKDPSKKRLLELINKTNQFNLNGVRLSEGQWMQHLADPASIVVSVSYEDKFGALGVIGVVAAKVADRRLNVSTWVMSCRAFSRQIDLHTLDHLFRIREIDDVALAFRSTERNSPMREFIHSVGLTANQQGEWCLSRETFLRGHHELPHEVAAPRIEPVEAALEA